MVGNKGVDVKYSVWILAVLLGWSGSSFSQQSSSSQRPVQTGTDDAEAPAHDQAARFYGNDWPDNTNKSSYSCNGTRVRLGGITMEYSKVTVCVGGDAVMLDCSKGNLVITHIPKAPYCETNH